MRSESASLCAAALSLLLGLALVTLPSCGCADDGVNPGSVPLRVMNMDGNPFDAGGGEPFVLHCQGIMDMPGTQGTVTFCAESGTPFHGGTSSEATVPVTVTGPNTVEGTTPPGVAGGMYDCVLKLDLPSSGQTDTTGGGPMATFETASLNGCGPSVVDVTQSSAFMVTGADLGPVGDSVLVRFCAPSGTPFNGGASDRLDVMGTITSSTQIDLTIPVHTITGGRVVPTVKVIMPSGTELTCPDQPTFNTPPSCVPETFTGAIGNVPLAADAGRNVLANETDPDGDALSVSGHDAASANGGTVSVAADGTFTYSPPAGFRGDDTFGYTITDGLHTCTATATVTVACCVWFIDDDAAAGGDGTLTTPFDDIADFNAIQNGGGATDPQTGDIVFLYSGNYAGGIVLRDQQCLIGQGVDLVVKSQTLVTAAAAPTLTQASGPSVTLAADNCVRGLALVASSGTCIVGSAVGTCVIEVPALTCTGGAALDLTGGAVDVDVGTVTCTSPAASGIRCMTLTGDIDITGAIQMTSPGAHGIHLEGCSATVDLAGVNVSQATTCGLYIENCSGAITQAGLIDIFSPGSRAICVTNSAGDVDLDRVTLIDPTGAAVYLLNNTGDFTIDGGGLIDANSATDANGVEAANCEGITISGVSTSNRLAITDMGTATGATAHAIRIDNCTTVHLEYLDIAHIGDAAGTAEHAVFLSGVVTSTFIRRVMIEDVRAGHGVLQSNNDIQGAYSFTYTNSEVRDTAFGCGVVCEPMVVGSGGSLDVTCQDSAMDNISDNCFHLVLTSHSGQATALKARVLRNVLDNMSASAVNLELLGSGEIQAQVDGNTMAGNPGMAHTPDHGVQVDASALAANHVTVGNNSCSGFGQQGVELFNTATSALVQVIAHVHDNVCTSSTGGGAVRALSTGASTWHVRLANNTGALNAAGTAVGLGGAATTSVVHAYLTGNDDDVDFTLHKASAGATLNLGGALGQGSAFATDNGNIAGEGNTNGGGAPTVTYAGGSENINIVAPASVQTATLP